MQKYFCFTEAKLRLYSPRPVPDRGVAQRHETRGGMRWTLTVPETKALFCGRPSRVVLAPRRRCQVGGSNSAGDGDKKARSPGRARNRPLTPSRAGMPGDSGGLVVTNSRVFLPTRGCGCIGRPAFPTPFWGRMICKTRAFSRRGNADSYLAVIARSGATKQSSFLLRCAKAGLLRYARNDG